MYKYSMHGYVYKTTNTLNGRTYVGQHAAQRFDPAYLGSGKLLKAAILKYGASNFKVEVLEWCESQNLLNEAEKKHISRQGERSYNLAAGGTGGNTLGLAPEERRAEAFSKRSSSMKKYHAHLCEEKRASRSAAISASRKGQRGNRLGKPHTAETRAKQRASNVLAAANRGKDWYDNHRTAMALRKGKPNPKAQKQVTINGITYESVTRACEILGVTRTTICNWRKNGKAT